jgi:hypothetical protein
MRVHEFVDEGLGHSSYVVEIGQRALIVDPPNFASPHTWASATGLELHVGR